MKKFSEFLCWIFLSERKSVDFMCMGGYDVIVGRQKVFR